MPRHLRSHLPLQKKDKLPSNVSSTQRSASSPLPFLRHLPRLMELRNTQNFLPIHEEAFPKQQTRSFLPQSVGDWAGNIPRQFSCISLINSRNTQNSLSIFNQESTVSASEPQFFLNVIPNIKVSAMFTRVMAGSSFPCISSNTHPAQSAIQANILSTCSPSTRSSVQHI